MSIPGESSNVQRSFSLTVQLLSVTNQWHQASYLGSLAGRVVNLLVTPLTAAIDAIVHCILLYVAIPLMFYTSNWNSSIKWLSEKLGNLDDTWHYPRSSAESSAAVRRFLAHVVSIIAVPILGFISPETTFKWSSSVQASISSSLAPSFHARSQPPFRSKEESYRLAQANIEDIQKELSIATSLTIA